MYFSSESHDFPGHVGARKDVFFELQGILTVIDQNVAKLPMERFRVNTNSMRVVVRIDQRTFRDTA